MRHLGRYLIILALAGLVGSACLVKSSPGRSSHSVSKHDNGKHKGADKHKKAKKHKKGHDKHR